jgi:hypothetical protein
MNSLQRALTGRGGAAKALPRMAVTELPGRDHQLNNDLGEIVDAIQALG